MQDEFLDPLPLPLGCTLRRVRPDDVEQLRPLLGQCTHHLPGLELFVRPLTGDEGYLPDAVVVVTPSGEVVGYAEMVERKDTAEVRDPVLLRGETDERVPAALRQALERAAARRGLKVLRPGNTSELWWRHGLAWLAFVSGLAFCAAAAVMTLQTPPRPGDLGSMAEWPIVCVFVGAVLAVVSVRAVALSLDQLRPGLPPALRVAATLAVILLVFGLVAFVWYFRLLHALDAIPR
jgi:hypothetical protein